MLQQSCLLSQHSLCVNTFNAVHISHTRFSMLKITLDQHVVDSCIIAVVIAAIQVVVIAVIQMIVITNLLHSMFFLCTYN